MMTSLNSAHDTASYNLHSLVLNSLILLILFLLFISDKFNQLTFLFDHLQMIIYITTKLPIFVQYLSNVML